ncbi:exonuclease domain-containing protein [Rhizobium leguminosarum]|uniref:exonuclease domain-containing protein n=1 Tax=Rhizobium leguminosarum TaxID=384 RepID=UPI00315DF904
MAPFTPAHVPLKGIILDTETTGLSVRKDEIIEIGVIAFTFDAAGRIPRPPSRYIDRSDNRPPA